MFIATESKLAGGLQRISWKLPDNPVDGKSLQQCCQQPLAACTNSANAISMFCLDACPVVHATEIRSHCRLRVTSDKFHELGSLLTDPQRSGLGQSSYRAKGVITLTTDHRSKIKPPRYSKKYPKIRHGSKQKSRPV